MGRRRAKAFAARNNRLRIIEGELEHLLAEHLNLDVHIDLGRPAVTGSRALAGITSAT
jgi:hypothetical protein